MLSQDLEKQDLTLLNISSTDMAVHIEHIGISRYQFSIFKDSLKVHFPSMMENPKKERFLIPRPSPIERPVGTIICMSSITSHIRALLTLLTSFLQAMFDPFVILYFHLDLCLSSYLQKRVCHSDICDILQLCPHI